MAVPRLSSITWQHALARLPASISVVEFDVDAINNETDNRALALRHTTDTSPAPIPLKGWRLNELVSLCPCGDVAEVIRRIVEYVEIVVQGRRDSAAAYLLALDVEVAGITTWDTVAHDLDVMLERGS